MIQNASTQGKGRYFLIAMREKRKNMFNCRSLGWYDPSSCENKRSIHCQAKCTHTHTKKKCLSLLYSHLSETNQSKAIGKETEMMQSC